jgi:nitrate/nitrite-specific signal transduction histidine kinase
MTRTPAGERSSFRIGRSLTLAATGVVVSVLLVGGASLALAVRIHRNNDAVMTEYDHIQRLDQVHSLFDDLIFELFQMDSTRRLDRASEALLMQEEILRKLDALAGLHLEQAGPGAPAGHILDDMRRLAEEGRVITKRLSAGSGRLNSRDFDWLTRVSHEVPRLAGDLAGHHRSRIDGLLAASQEMLKLIVGLYAAWIVVGGGLVLAAHWSARHNVALPLETLADAARAIADGRLDTRVRVDSANEIGLLATTFNGMADRLHERDRELERARLALEDKVREAQALYRIGTEIAGLQQLDRVLQSIVEKARELLRADAAALWLCAADGREITAKATSGPPEAFRVASDGPGGSAVPDDGQGQAAACPLIQPEYVRSQLAASLRLEDGSVGGLCVGTREEREFSPDAADLLAGLATQGAVAIERTRLTEELRSLAAVEERERLAREMHDGLAQALGLLHLKVNCALSRCAEAPALGADLHEMAQITKGAYEDVRQSIFGLRTFVSRGLGIVATLAEYLHEFSAQNGLTVELETPGGHIGPVPPSTEVQAIRIIQEALINVRKHASASRAYVRLQRDGGWLRVTIEDDGVGWDPTPSPGAMHFGVQMMRERAESLGGRLEVDSAPGRGARVVATLPGGVA